MASQSEDPLPLDEATLATDKITVLPGAAEDMSAATFCILEEDHTLGNLLRWMIMKNPAVEFCGYSAPHPAEAKIHIRIQTYDGVSTLKVLHEALDNCEAMTESILAAYEDSLATDDFARPEEVAMDFESIDARLWAAKEAAGLGTKAEFEAAKEEKAQAERALAEAARAKPKKKVKAEK